MVRSPDRDPGRTQTPPLRTSGLVLDIRSGSFETELGGALTERQGNPVNLLAPKLGPKTLQIWRKLQLSWALVGACTLGVWLGTPYMSDAVRLTLREPILAVMSLLSDEPGPASERDAFVLPVIGIVMTAVIIWLKRKMHRGQMGRLSSIDEVLERLSGAYLVITLFGAAPAITGLAFYIVTGSRLALTAMSLIGITAWVFLRPRLGELRAIVATTPSIGEPHPAPHLESVEEPPPFKMPILLLVLDVLLFGLWALVLVVGGFYSWSVVVGFWPGLIAIPGLLPKMLVPAVVIAPMTILAYFRPPQPLTIRIVGIATLVFLLGLGLAIWPILAGARMAAKAKVPVAIVFLASGLAYALGVTLAFALLLNAEGIDLLILFGPIWAGGASVGGCLYLVSALVRQESIPLVLRHPLGVIVLLITALSVTFGFAHRAEISSLANQVMPLFWEITRKQEAYHREHRTFASEKSELGLESEDHFYDVAIAKADFTGVAMVVRGRLGTAGIRQHARLDSVPGRNS